MISLEELDDLSFRNRVLFYTDELLEMHDTGKRWRYGCFTSKIWRDICVATGVSGKKGRRMILTPRTIAVLCGLWEIDNIDEDIGGVRLSELDILKRSIQPPPVKIKKPKPIKVKKKRPFIPQSKETRLKRSLSMKRARADPTSGYHTEKYRLSLSSPSRRANQSKAMLRHYAWKKCADVFEILFAEESDI